MLASALYVRLANFLPVSCPRPTPPCFVPQYRWMINEQLGGLAQPVTWPTLANSPPVLIISPGMADVATPTKSFLSGKVAHFTESVIREMTRKAMMYDAVNLAQGFPDFPAPAEIKRAAQEAIAADINQYAITWGAKSLRNAIARKFQEWQGMTVDPETELTCAAARPSPSFPLCWRVGDVFRPAIEV